VSRSARAKLALALVGLVALGGEAAAQDLHPSAQPAPVRYVVSLAAAPQHLVRVNLLLPRGTVERSLQLPVWNALYQVLDFSQYVRWVRATTIGANTVAGNTVAGAPLDVRLLDKSRWQVGGAENGASVEYEIAADQPGPQGAQINSHHAFFNLAEILMYPVDARSAPAEIRFQDVPAGWRIATTLASLGPDAFSANGYDQLVDAPVEIGSFQEVDFEQGGGHYRVVVDAQPADYDMRKIVPLVQRIVAAATGWMNDRPFDTYLFIYHIPHDLGGTGMEHADSTAIDINARVLAESLLALPEVTAHEFFHLWNVKRIRPQSLEPIDYTRENYSRALWFSEGVTNTVEDYLLLRAGLLDEPHSLGRLAGQIQELEQRPARLTQSAEESSLDAWLEKYPQYALPQRSISYYNKGGLLGVMLDLTVRDASNGCSSLRDILQWMNQNYARQSQFFPDSEGVRRGAEAVSHADLGWFFQKYVAGTEEIPWDDFFRSVGLRLVRHAKLVADLGFSATRIFDAPPQVIWVNSGSNAEGAGLASGDAILRINGQAASSDFYSRLAQLHPGDTLRLWVRNSDGEHEVHWKLTSRKEVGLDLADVDNVTPQQKARRSAWLKGESQMCGETRP
jgi:predicted metalloprotease with PDZ domain